MAEYDIAFGGWLAETTDMLADEGLSELDAQRTVVYLGLLCTEITLKAMLDNAGMRVFAIRARYDRLQFDPPRTFAVAKVRVASSAPELRG